MLKFTRYYNYVWHTVEVVDMTFDPKVKYTMGYSS